MYKVVELGWKHTVMQEVERGWHKEDATSRSQQCHYLCEMSI